MKKLISLLLAVVMLVSLAVPAFAVDEPTEIGPGKNNDIGITNKGNYIINEDCEVISIMASYDNFTLTIAKGVTVKVTKALYNNGSINVLGTLIIADEATADNSGTINVRGTLSITDAAKAESRGTINVVGTLIITDAAYAKNTGTVRVCGCTGGKLEGTIDNSGLGTVTTCDGHYYVDGKCFACGYECTHEGVKCNTCGKKFSQKAISSEGGIASTISEGNMTIATGIAGFAVGMAVMFVIMRKKKAE